jgi:hydrophobic/amphiphilic exporter-1 (mainly G- bacteria), HAE1 family
MLLRPKKKSTGLLGKFFAWFNRVFGRATDGYVHSSSLLIHKSLFSMVLLALVAAVAMLLGGRIPSSFLPQEDQGYLFGGIQLPDAASLQRTEAATRKVEAILAQIPGVSGCTTVNGYSLLSGVSNTYSAFFFITLKPWSERKAPEEQADALLRRINGALYSVQDGYAFSFPPPAIPGIGASGGFTFILEDRTGNDLSFLTQNVQTFMAAAHKRPELAGVTTTFLPTVPQVSVAVDRAKVLQEGVLLRDVYQTMQVFMGGALVNYFNQFGRQWQVRLQAEGQYRTRVEDLGEFYVNNPEGGRVPLSTLTLSGPQAGPEFTMRYNQYRAAQINGNAAPGFSANQATAALEEVFAKTMPEGMGFDYMGMSYQEQKAAQGVSPALVFSLSGLFVFLILAAQYESWSIPFSVLLGVPIAMFGAFLALWLRRMENDVYAQIGLVMLIGMAAKNAILIVEFAKANYDSGMPLIDAALQGARVRLRPILMTAFAFILGMVPLWAAVGAGGVSRRVLGTVVIGGMLAASVIAIFIIPVTFVVVERISARFGRKQKGEPA